MGKLIKELLTNHKMAYSNITNPFELVRKTHSEEPWIKGRKSGVISEKDMKDYYGNNLNKLYNIQEN